MKIFGVAVLLFWQTSALALTLPEYIKIVESKHRSIQSLDISKEAADLREEAGDIELVPTLVAGVNYTNDKSPLSQFALLGATESKTLTYNLGLGKKFSSGTTVGLSAAATDIENSGNVQVPRYAQMGVGSLGVSLSQNLWRDSFGHATRLRRERQAAATTAQKDAYDLQAQSIVVSAESSFWNYFLANEALRIGRESLDRAKKIESWTKRRVADGISDRADLLETQGLVSTRQLQLITVQDDLETSKREIRDAMELPDSEPFPNLEGDITQLRSLMSLIHGEQKGRRIVSMEAYVAHMQAKASSIAAREVEDAYRPDLVLSGAYNTNSWERNMGNAIEHWTNTDQPTAKIGLNLVYMFDTSVKNAARDAAKKDALAAKLQSERQLLNSDSNWLELNRRYVEMTKRVEAAEETVRIQKARSKAQTDLFNKGRSITFNVVNSEEDVATAELNLYRLRAEQRKMEAQGRFFITIDNQALE